MPASTSPSRRRSARSPSTTAAASASMPARSCALAGVGGGRDRQGARTRHLHGGVASDLGGLGPDQGRVGLPRGGAWRALGESPPRYSRTRRSPCRCSISAGASWTSRCCSCAWAASRRSPLRCGPRPESVRRRLFGLLAGLAADSRCALVGLGLQGSAAGGGSLGDGFQWDSLTPRWRTLASGVSRLRARGSPRRCAWWPGRSSPRRQRRGRRSVARMAGLTMGFGRPCAALGPDSGEPSPERRPRKQRRPR